MAARAVLELLFEIWTLGHWPGINWKGISQTKRKLCTQRPFQWKGKAKKIQGIWFTYLRQRSYRSKASPCFELRRSVAELPRVCLWSSQGPRSDLRKGIYTSGCAAYTAEMLHAFLFVQLGPKTQLHGNFLFWWVPVFWHCQLTHFFSKRIANDFRGLPRRITGSLRTLRVQPPWPCQYHRGTYEPSWFASCAGFWTRVAWNRELGNHGSPMDFAPWEPRNIETSLIS